MGYGVDDITIASGTTVTGSVVGTGYSGIDDSNDLLDGADTIHIDGTLTGNVATGAGVDVLDLDPAGSISGFVNFGSGADVFTYNFTPATRINSYLNMGRDNDTLTISTDFNPSTKATNAAVTGMSSISVITGYGADTFTVDPGIILTGEVVTTGSSNINDTGDTDLGDTLNINGAVTSNMMLGGGVDQLILNPATGSIGGFVHFGMGADVFDYNFPSQTQINGYLNMY